MHQSWRGMSTDISPAKGRAAKVVPADPDSLVRFAELLKLRSLSPGTQAMYLRFVRKLAARTGGDPAVLTEVQIRAHLLYLKQERAYSPSSMRTAVAAMRAYFGLHLGHAWKLFDLVRSPDAKTLPTVLTREELARFFGAVRERRFQMLFRLIYACGLRISEALKLEVTDIKKDGPRLHIRGAKGLKDRYVPLPSWAYQELRVWWLTHRHPKWVFPGFGSGRHTQASAAIVLPRAVEPMCADSVRQCLRLIVAVLGLPKGMCVHTLRHCYATHLLEEGVNLRLISAYLGHASLETTMIYLHLTAANEATTHAALARLQPPPSPGR